MAVPIAAVVEGGIRGLCQGVPQAIGVFQRNRVVNQIIDRAGQAGVPLAEDGIRGAGRLVDDGLRNAGNIVNDGARRVGQVAEDGIRNVGDAADQWNRTVQAGTVEAAREARDSYRDVKREVGEWNHLLRKFTVLTGRNLLVWISVCGVGAVGAVWQRVFCTPDSQSWLCTTASLGSMLVFASMGGLAYQILSINVQKIREMKDKPDDLSIRISEQFDSSNLSLGIQSGVIGARGVREQTDDNGMRNSSCPGEISSSVGGEASQISHQDNELNDVLDQIQERRRKINILRERARESIKHI